MPRARRKAKIVPDGKEHRDDQMDARPDILPFAAARRQSAGRDARLCRGVRAEARCSRLPRRGRCRSRLAQLCDDRGRRRHAECRRRASPLRLERVQLLSLPQRAASAYRAALPRGAGPALVPHPHHRHQARSETAEHRAGDRARRDDRGHGLQPAAHRALRARRHLCLGARRRRRARRRAASS